MDHHEKINYIELPAKNLLGSKAFFEQVFNWSFVDYGPEYSAFENAGMDGGFFRSDMCANADKGSALVVLYSEALEATQEKVIQAGGKIKQDIFTFPGGRRFHFTDPSDNEYAVWSDK